MSINLASNVYKVVYQNYGGGTTTTCLPFATDQKAKDFKDYYNSITKLGKIVYMYRVAEISGANLKEYSYMNLKIMYWSGSKEYNTKIPFLEYTIKKSQLNRLFSFVDGFKQIDLIQQIKPHEDLEE